MVHDFHVKLIEVKMAKYLISIWILSIVIIIIYSRCRTNLLNEEFRISVAERASIGANSDAGYYIDYRYYLDTITYYGSISTGRDCYLNIKSKNTKKFLVKYQPSNPKNSKIITTKRRSLKLAQSFHATVY
jgi:hypothetical protein